MEPAAALCSFVITHEELVEDPVLSLSIPLLQQGFSSTPFGATRRFTVSHEYIYSAGIVLQM